MSTIPAPIDRGLPHDHARHLIACHFLVEEAFLLDEHRWDDWIVLLTADIRYVMPVRVTTMANAGSDTLDDMAHFDEDHYSLAKRVERLGTEHAWTEDPRSRTRHLVTNIRTGDGPDNEIRVDSSVLLIRSRGDDRPVEMLSAGRRDVLRCVGDGTNGSPDNSDGSHGWRLAVRWLTVDESVLRTQNLAILL